MNEILQWIMITILTLVVAVPVIARVVRDFREEDSE